MSGPKDYSPPPSYSMQVFDGKLNEVFRLQSRLKMLCSEIEGLYLSDEKLSIYFDCKDGLAKLEKSIDASLKNLVFDFKGTFDQSTYDRIDKEIESKISSLRKQQTSCEIIKTDFAGKKADYESYLTYLRFYDNSKISFDEFKSQIILYLENNLKAEVPDIFDEAESKISEVEFQQKTSPFNFGFNAKIDSEKQFVIHHVTQKEDEINRIRDDISNKTLNALNKTGAAVKRTTKQISSVPEDTGITIEKIKTLVRRCDDAAAKQNYSESLRLLTESDSLKDLYFFKELHDSILETEKNRKLKIEIKKLILAINEEAFHLTTQDEQQSLVKLCIRHLNLSAISKAELDSLSIKRDLLKRRSDKLFEEDAIKQKEHLFLKSQTMLCLENLGYEVMDDLEVIDFEKENDFLLKIRNQENYLNLKFKEDGSMRYVFQIPENQDVLSVDQKKTKLHEMQVTCDEFKGVLRDLSKMGLKIELRKEKPVDFDSLVTVPLSKQNKLKVKSATKQQKQQLKKKYLNL